MSRYREFYSEPTENAIQLWQSNVRKALRGRRGRKALIELREALLSLENKRLISDVIYDGKDVCAIGAYALYQDIKSGVDYSDAVAYLPRIKEPLEETASFGKDFGLTYTLAWELAYRNDETYGNLTPEARYKTFLAWIDRELGATA